MRRTAACRHGMSSTLNGTLALQIQCGVNFFILDSRRVFGPSIQGAGIQTYLKSRFCLQAIFSGKRLFDRGGYIKLFLHVFSRPEGFCLTRAILAHFKIIFLPYKT